LPESEFGRADVATARPAAPRQIEEQTHRQKKAVIRTGDKRRKDFIAGYLQQPWKLAAPTTRDGINCNLQARLARE
jgi:hypothetical protein